VLASVVIRTYNEEKYLDTLLSNILTQSSTLIELEIVIVDSGSTDKTLSIAKKHACRITYINKADFTYGRSLNIGCNFAQGEFLVFVSGHCIPTHNYWLDELIKPLITDQLCYSYGRQEGKETTKFSEYRHFEKCFPTYSKQPQEGFFCNNANAAMTKKTWEQFKFNEELTGLEDMFMAKQLVEAGGEIAYVNSASVYHIHDETWQQIRIRYEREAYALQCIMPEVHFTFSDFLRFYLSSIFSDFAIAIQKKVFLQKLSGILIYRLMQYWGTYRGNQEHRKLSRQRKMNYFYPKDLEKENYEE
jgi:glycosyltransferase involved in cell wall biosynthesis